MTDRLRELMLHPDRTIRQQGLELARTVGDESSRQILGGLPLDAQGTLWPPSTGWSTELLDLLLDFPAPHVRGLVLPDTEAGADERLARLPAAFPALERLDLAHSAIRDLTPLARLPGLTELSLRGCAALQGIAPLAALHALASLDLSETPIRDLGPLARHAQLRALNLEGCILTDGLRSLPTAITTLRLRNGLLEERLVLEGRPLGHLSVGSLDWLPARHNLPHLQTLTLDRGDDLAALEAWPVVRLWLRAPADVDHLPRLRWLQVDGDVETMALPPGLVIVHPTSTLPFPDWWGARVCTPALLRRLDGDLWAPLRAESDIFWRSEGFRTRLTLLESPSQGRVPLVKRLRARFGGALMERVHLMDALIDGRLGWLHETQAATLQAQLLAIGVFTLRSPQ